MNINLILKLNRVIEYKNLSYYFLDFHNAQIVSSRARGLQSLIIYFSCTGFAFRPQVRLGFNWNQVSLLICWLNFNWSRAISIEWDNLVKKLSKFGLEVQTLDWFVSVRKIAHIRLGYLEFEYFGIEVYTSWIFTIVGGLTLKK